MKPERIDSWKCASCGRVYTDQAIAERCCICQKCGRDSGNGTLFCMDCQRDSIEKARQERYEKANPVPWDAYDGAGVYVEGVGPEYVFGDWSPDAIAMIWESYNEEPFPGFDTMRVWGTYAEPIELDIDVLEDSLNDGAYEDYEIDGSMHDDLAKLCDEWNAKHGDKTCWPDETVRIVYEGGDAAWPRR